MGQLDTYFDGDKLEKILANLLTNAIKFTPINGAVSVSLAFKNSELVLDISDSGPGISHEQQQRIFDRFYQVESKNETVGSGVGLALVQELVNVYRGRINVDSTIGKGTVFKVYLPVYKEAFNVGEIIQDQSIAVSVSDSKAIHLTQEVSIPASSEDPDVADLPLVLIVEDNTDLLRFTGDILRPHYRILGALNGTEGWEKATTHLPDLIISDIMMPGIDGLELCERIRQDERTSHIPLILLTAKAGEADKVIGLQEGADEYITKPFKQQELLSRVGNLIEQRQRLKQIFAKELVLGPERMSVPSLDGEFLKKVHAAIEDNLASESFSVTELAELVGFSRSQLHRKLKAISDKSPNKLIRKYRLQRAYQLLEQQSGTISEVAYQVGYTNLSYFSKSFKEEFGLLPKEING
ncbi:MAG: ATP-binding protein [Bacteroidota bacterium]